MTLEEALAVATVDDGPVDDVIIIDAQSKTILLPASEVLFGVEGDKDVERKYFKCPRIVGDNIDLFTHQIYVNYIFAENKNGTFPKDTLSTPYWCDDVTLDETGNYITFSWLLSGNVLTHPGFVAFAIVAKYVDVEVLKTRWKTTPAVGTVLMTVPDSGQSVAELYPEIITQLLQRMDEVEKAEEIRAGAEAIRKSAETERASSEAARKEAENARVEAENKRQQNENTRIQQEQERQRNTSQAVKNADAATAAAQQVTKDCEKVTERAESTLQNQEQLEATLNTATQIRQEVSQMQSAVEAAKKQVEQDKQDIDDTIQNSLLASAEKIIESVQDYFNRAEALYSSMYLDCDGETPYLRTVTPIFIDGATPQVRNTNEGVDFDGGTPTSRLLAV